MPINHLPLNHLLSSTDPSDFAKRKSLSDVSLAVAKARRVVVVSGAGISCSSGIPDFRSADGLYSLVKARYPCSFVTGRDLFSSGLFSNPTTTSLFYTFIAELSIACSAAKPTRTHHFLSKLEGKGKLLRSYTQNVDGLERSIGLESGGRGKGLRKKGTKNVELHGDLGRVRCVLCMADFEAKREWVEMFREGEAPGCPACEERSASRISRSARALPIGTLRPAIVLYDEPHPLGDDIGELQSYDLTRSPDLLLIMGTSLKVHGLKRLVKEFAKVVHAKKGLVVFVNATPPSKEWEGIIDMHVHGETDRWVRRVEEEWRKFRPQDWETQTLLDGEVIQVIAKTTCKPKGLKTSSKGNIPPEQVQLPTPRSSQSPRKSPVKKRTSSNLPSSPLSSISDSSCQSGPSSPGMAPPTPLSPSKRRANVAPPPPEGGVSPTKRSKAIFPPSTGISGTPGRGNLFASPTKAATAYEWVDEEVFGSPVLKVQSRSRRAVTTGKENNPVRSATRMRKPAEKAVLKTRKTTAPAVRRRTTSTVLAG